MFKKAKNVLYFCPREARSNENNSIFASPSSVPSHTPNKARSKPTIHEERWGKRGRTRERQLFENFLLSPTLFLLTPERNGSKLQRGGRREREKISFLCSPPPLFPSTARNKRNSISFPLLFFSNSFGRPSSPLTTPPPARSPTTRTSSSTTRATP